MFRSICIPANEMLLRYDPGVRVFMSTPRVMFPVQETVLPAVKARVALSASETANLPWSSIYTPWIVFGAVVVVEAAPEIGVNQVLLIDVNVEKSDQEKFTGLPVKLFVKLPFVFGTELPLKLHVVVPEPAIPVTLTIMSAFNAELARNTSVIAASSVLSIELHLVDKLNLNLSILVEGLTK
jgi:hypothetical protein